MLNRNKKGFTIVELVIVIAVIAVLAAVLIPTFAGIIKKANESAYLQERTNQMMADLAEKITNEDYYTWEDFESKIADELAKLEAENEENGLSPDEIQKAIENAIAEYEAKLKGNDTGLTEEQIKAIIEKALEGSLTISQVQSIVNAAIGKLDFNTNNVPPEVVQQIINDAIKDLQNSGKEIGISKEDIQAAIDKAIEDAKLPQDAGMTPDQLQAAIDKAVEDALANFTTGGLTAAEIEKIINDALSKLNGSTGGGSTDTGGSTEPGDSTVDYALSIDLENFNTTLTAGSYTALPNVSLAVNGTDDPTASFTWTSNNPAVVSITGGYLAAVSAGTAKITVTSNPGAISDSFTVVVTATETPNDPIPPVEDVHVTGIALDKTTAALEIEGLDEKKTVTLTVTFSPNTATNKNVNWSSSKESVATVDANGVVTAVGVGTTTITVTTEDGGYSATCEVTVTKHQHALINITYVDETYHEGYCTACETTIKNIQHHYTNGVCACSDQKIYTYTCGSTGVHSYSVKKDANGKVYYQSGNQWLELSKCTREPHSNKEENHYNCPANNCTNCLHDTGCTHPKGYVENKSYAGSSAGHMLICNDCHETNLMPHVQTSSANTMCKVCGYCTHENANGKSTINMSSLDETYHVRVCSQHCGFEMKFKHTLGSTYDKTTTHHILTCEDCNAQFSEEHSWNGDICTICEYDRRCQHTFEWVVTNTTHTEVCTKCSLSQNSANHDVSEGDNQCSTCKSFFVSNNDQFAAAMKHTEDSKFTIFVMENFTAEKITYPTRSKRVITIDFMDHVITYNGDNALIQTVSGDTIILKNGKIQAYKLSYPLFGVSAGTSTSKTKLSFDNFTVDAKSVSTRDPLKVINFTNYAQLEIKNSEFIMSESPTSNLYAIYTSGSMGNSSISIVDSDFKFGNDNSSGGNASLVYHSGTTTSTGFTVSVKDSSVTVNDAIATTTFFYLNKKLTSTVSFENVDFCGQTITNQWASSSNNINPLA